MRTTIRLDDALLAEAKQYAARTGRTLTALIEDAVREVLARAKRGRRRKRTRLPSVGGRGTLPGVDLDNAAALFDIMDRSE